MSIFWGLLHKFRIRNPRTIR